MSISERTIEDIKARTDIVDVVGSYMRLKRAGGTAHKGLCPFHQEKTPSFTVDSRRQAFKCFGCGEGGSVFSFIMKIEGMDFPTSVRFLGKRVGVAVEEERYDHKGPRKTRVLGMNQAAAGFFRDCLLNLPEAEAARAYVADRQLDGDIGEAFNIGYAPEAWDNMVNLAKERGYNQEELDATGLQSHKDEEANRKWDRFRDRLMFPICDEMGQVIGFSGRILDPEKNPAKYVNSPETMVFHKSRVLYGLDRARTDLVKIRRAVICEGQIDVIRCHQAGITHAVAAQGTALTLEQAGILDRYVDEVCLLLDSDKAGINAALRSGETFIEAGLALQVASLPEGEDPDSLILARGADAVQEVLDQAKPFLEFQLDVLFTREDPNTAAGLKKISEAILDTIARSESGVAQDQMLEVAATRLNVSREALRNDLKKFARPKLMQARVREQKRQERQREAPTVPELPGPDMRQTPKAEEELLQLLFKHPTLVGAARELAPAEMLSDESCRLIAEALYRGNPEQPESVYDGLAGIESESALAMIRRCHGDPKTLGKEMGGELDALHDLVFRLYGSHLEISRRQLHRRHTVSGPTAREQLDIEIAQHTVAIAKLGQAARQRDIQLAQKILSIYNPAK